MYFWAGAIHCNGSAYRYPSNYTAYKDGNTNSSSGFKCCREMMGDKIINKNRIAHSAYAVFR